MPTAPRTLFQGNEFMRLATMIVMLAVLFMLIQRSGDPNTWNWLVGNNNELKPAKGPAETAETNMPREIQALPGAPTDRDPEEAEALKEELQAVTDGTLKIQHVEKNAYYRMLRWVQNQTFSEMRKRAQKNVEFNQFFQSPDKYRGQLFELEITARLIRDLDEKYNGNELYDIWGTTKESGNWLYNGLVIDLPRGMPIGRETYEKVTLVGYFFKLQGYQPAGAKPNAPALQAPLFIGRLLWHPAEKPQVQRSDWYWGLFLLLGFLAFIIIRWGLLLWKPRRKYTTSSVLTKSGGLSVQEWLTEAETDGLREGGGSEEAADSPDEDSDIPL